MHVRARVILGRWLVLPAVLSLAALSGCNCGATNGTTDGGGGGSDAAPGSREDPATVCARWTGDRSTLTEGTWSGNIASCDPGDMSPEGRTSALRLLNLYRWLGRLPEVEDEGSRNSDAQACALMMNANGQLSHTPPPSWSCYSGAGANGAGTANLAGSPGVSAMDLYMADPGNPTTIGHRRWILANSTGPVGIGSTSSFSCLVILTGTGNAAVMWEAWPPPGPIPAEAASMLDFTGWTIQSDYVDLGGATATVTAGGASRAVTVVQLDGGYGSNWAINLVPLGWGAASGTTYHVEVTGTSVPISYDVDVIACP